MGEIKFFTSLVLIVVFTLAVVGYAVNFGADNNSAVQISDDPTMSSIAGNLKTDVSSLSEDMDSASTGFFNTKIEAGDETTRTGGQFKLGVTNMVTTFKSILSVIKEKIFGGSEALGYFITVLGGVVVFISIRYIWKTWKGGNPD